jgi:thioredoxin reductase (NADPH)
LAFEVEIVDIDQHPDMEARWGDKVPVLLYAGQEICHYFLDEGALQRALV